MEMPRRRPPDPQVSDLIQDREWDKVTSAIVDCHPADIADIIDRSDPAIRRHLFSIVNDKAKPDVLAELESTTVADVIGPLSDNEIADIIDEMAPDDAADVLGELTEERSSKILGMMEARESEDVRKLLKYDEETAGGIMTTDIVAMRETQSVADAIQAIANMDSGEHFLIAYIVDEQEKLIGYVDIWTLLREPARERHLGALVNRNFIAANVNIDQEEVVQLIKQYDLSSIPVIDNNGVLLGRITADDVIDVMEDEASEDIFKLSGSDDAELESYSAIKRSMVRLPWLLITLFGGFFVSIIMNRYMKVISNVVTLVSFVPVVLAMGGNTGIQSSTLIVRRIALGTLGNQKLSHLLLREITAGALMGSVCAVIIGTGAYILNINNDSVSAFDMSLLVGTALFCAMTFASTFGTLVPIVLHKLRIDPAISSGPFITIANDIAALLIYFLVTVVLLHKFI